MQFAGSEKTAVFTMAMCSQSSAMLALGQSRDERSAMGKTSSNVICDSGQILLSLGLKSPYEAKWVLHRLLPSLARACIHGG